MNVTSALLATLLSAQVAAPNRAPEPTFDAEFWYREGERARSKMRRGGGLTLAGASLAVPTAFLIRGAVDNPDRHLAWSLALGIATIGMTAHGIGSLGFGKKQRDRAEDFNRRLASDPEAIDVHEQWRAIEHDRRKSAVKFSLFGGVLTLQGALLLANGIALSTKSSRGDSVGGAPIWPSYVVGGLLLSGGMAVIVLSARRLSALERASPPSAASSSRVWILPDVAMPREGGGLRMGVNATLRF